MDDKTKYGEWIRAFVNRHEGNILGLCHRGSTEMAAAFPELTVVRGHVYDLRWGKRGHWWCTAPDGSVVDPTAGQFLRVMEYVPWTPGEEVRVGRCMECGEEIWEEVEVLTEDASAAFSKRFCGVDCESSCIAGLREQLEGL